MITRITRMMRAVSMHAALPACHIDDIADPRWIYWRENGKSIIARVGLYFDVEMEHHQ